MRHPELLARSRLSVISAEPDHELDRIARTIAGSVRVEGPAELAAYLDGLVAASDPEARAAPRTLDLLGHSTARTALLRLGDWVIDGSRPDVTRWFRTLADRGVLPRLGIRAIRLLGCRTAGTEEGRATICTLGEILGVEVHGTTHLLHAGHYGEHGFIDAWQFMLIDASAMRRPEPTAAAYDQPRVLDLAALPALVLAPHTGRWPRRVVTAELAGEILRLIRRDAGAPMPGLGSPPSYELALPSTIPNAYHIAEVLLDGAFLRFFPEPDAPGVAYPVDDAPALNRLLGALPASVTP